MKVLCGRSALFHSLVFFSRQVSKTVLFQSILEWAKTYSKKSGTVCGILLMSVIRVLFHLEKLVRNLIL